MKPGRSPLTRRPGSALRPRRTGPLYALVLAEENEHTMPSKIMLSSFVPGPGGRIELLGKSGRAPLGSGRQGRACHDPRGRSKSAARPPRLGVEDHGNRPEAKIHEMKMRMIVCFSARRLSRPPRLDVRDIFLRARHAHADTGGPGYKAGQERSPEKRWGTIPLTRTFRTP
ncbi:MAG: hypothetical protein MZV63_46985 [Marinilabiliales bacterium]|nr:hypothetical protein [Marinilabiliales bacterium]